MTLRLVHPAPAPPPPKQRRPRASTQPFSDEEANRVRAALRTARRNYGTWRALADALGVESAYLQKVVAGGYGHPVSGSLVIRLARALSVTVESLYRAPTDASVCPTCGRSKQP